MSSAKPNGPAMRPIRALSSPRSSAPTCKGSFSCARGEMENRTKECQLDLFAGRTSAATMRANQLRLRFASAAYVLLSALAPHRAGAHSVRQRHLRYGPAQAAQDRRASASDGSAWPWHPPAHGNMSSHWRTPCSEKPAPDRREPDVASQISPPTPPRGRCRSTAPGHRFFSVTAQRQAAKRRQIPHHQRSTDAR